MIPFKHIALTAVLMSSSFAFASAGLERSRESVELVTGRIYQVKERHSYPKDFVFQKDSVAIVILKSCENNSEYTGCFEVSREVIRGPTEFPIYFKLKGKMTEACTGDRICLLNATVRSDGKVKTDQVGDLITEDLIEIDRLPTRDLTVVATGLEPCGTPEAGGFCL